MGLWCRIFSMGYLTGSLRICLVGRGWCGGGMCWGGGGRLGCLGEIWWFGVIYGGNKVRGGGCILQGCGQSIWQEGWQKICSAMLRAALVSLVGGK
jgi:hypothetical protein